MKSQKNFYNKIYELRKETSNYNNITTRQIQTLWNIYSDVERFKESAKGYLNW